MHLPAAVFQEIATILKIQLKKPALPWYWTCLLSEHNNAYNISNISYLLAFVQLTWQVDNG